MTMEENIGNIKSIEIAYERTQEYIVYDSFKTVMIAIVLFLVFMKLFDEYQKTLQIITIRLIWVAIGDILGFI